MHTPVNCYLIVACLALCACSTTTSRLKTRFANEHGCSPDLVRVDELGGTVYRASGCGETAEYVCGTFAGAADPARSCHERGAPRRAPPGDEPKPFPERMEHLTPAESSH